MRNLAGKVVVAASLVLSLVAFASAQSTQQPPPPGPPPGPMMHRGMGPMGMAMGMLRGLDLTAEQRQQMQAIMKDQRQAHQADQQRLGDLHRALHAEIFADNPDMGKIDGLKNQITALQATLMSAHLETMVKISQLLTPEQRQKARDMKPGEGRRGPRGPR